MFIKKIFIKFNGINHIASNHDHLLTFSIFKTVEIEECWNLHISRCHAHFVLETMKKTVYRQILGRQNGCQKMMKQTKCPFFPNEKKMTQENRRIIQKFNINLLK